jgi:hypothetical protein
MPRHPPCALHSLSHHTTNPHHPNPPTQTKQDEPANGEGDRRCTRNTPQRTNTHPTQSAGRMHKNKKKHTPPTPTHQKQARRNRQMHLKMLASTIQISNNNPTPPHTPQGGHRHGRVLGTEAPGSRLILQNPNSVPPPPDPSHEEPRPPSRGVPGVGRCRCSTAKQHQPPPHDPTGTAPAGGDEQVYVLLRKEVIQPHLPVRLPCYDFVPIASPTFDHSPR